MADAVMTDADKDEKLTQFLSMTEDRVDPDVAQNLLEVVGWDVQAAMEQIFGGPGSPGGRPAMAIPHEVPAVALDGPEGEDADQSMMEHGLLDGGEDMMAAAAADREGSPAGAAVGAEQLENDPGSDAQLAAAIEASYHTQTSAGREQSEEELLAQALRISQQEEDCRQRQNLRNEQEAELAESVLMDQMREQQEREMRQVEAESKRLAEEQKVQEEQEKVAEMEAKRQRLTEEPAVGEAERMAVLFRLPGGQRLQRAFRASEAVGMLYDFVDLQNADLAAQKYRLVSTMPRKAYEDRQQSLRDAGIQNQFVLMVELSAGL